MNATIFTQRVATPTSIWHYFTSSSVHSAAMAAARSLSLLRNRAWIGGSWTSATGGAVFPVFNPSTGEKVADVADTNQDDAEAAIQEAHRAQPRWGATVGKERAQLLRELYNLVVANQEDIATLISLESGKPLVEARGEVSYASSFIDWFSEEAKRIYGDLIPATAPGRRILVTRQPVGVAALVTPWNFPLAVAMRKVSAALAAGCSCIVKPSEETPLTTLTLAELIHRAGFPPGVFNVLPASRTNSPLVGNHLCDSPLVRKLSFTGSTAVGKLLMQRSANTMKRLSMELGGNAPLVVFDSADVGLAVQGTVAAKFRNTGQTCISSNRILVQSGIHDRFVAALTDAVSRLQLGDAFQEGVNQGPLINEAAITKVEGHVSDAVSKGAEVTVGGGRDDSLGKLFYRPAVLSGASTQMLLAHEETFGPIAPVMKFEEEEEAISIANNTPFGLASYIFTSDLSQSWRVSEALQSGMVGVNEGAISSEVVPFGGIKESGFGREGSKYGMADYQEIKYVCIGGVTEREL